MVWYMSVNDNLTSCLKATPLPWYRIALPLLRPGNQTTVRPMTGQSFTRARMPMFPSPTLPCGTTQHKNTNFNIQPQITTQNRPYATYTTPTPDFPDLRDFRDFRPNFERDSCIETPYFRWTPLPEAIPSRRILPSFRPFFDLRDIPPQ